MLNDDYILSLMSFCVFKYKIRAYAAARLHFNVQCDISDSLRLQQFLHEKELIRKKSSIYQKYQIMLHVYICQVSISLCYKSDVMAAVVIMKQCVRKSSKTFVKALKQQRVETNH